MTLPVHHLLATVLFVLALFGSSAPLGAQPTDEADTQAESEQQVDATDIAELQRQIEILAEELERLRSGEESQDELSEDETRALGLAPSAAAAYEGASGV